VAAVSLTERRKRAFQHGGKRGRYCDETAENERQYKERLRGMVFVLPLPCRREEKKFNRYKKPLDHAPVQREGRKDR